MSNDFDSCWPHDLTVRTTMHGRLIPTSLAVERLMPSCRQLEYRRDDSSRPATATRKSTFWPLASGLILVSNRISRDPCIPGARSRPFSDLLSTMLTAQSRYHNRRAPLYLTFPLVCTLHYINFVYRESKYMRECP